MKERPILFSGDMVRALLRDENPKTQTRRIVKLPHENPLGQWEPTMFGGPDGGRTADGATIPLQGGIWHTRTGDCLMSPYGQPGDHLYVRETHEAFGRWETRFNEKKKRDEWHFVDMTVECGLEYRYEPTAKRGRRIAGAAPIWHVRPSIFMPRAASRITLEVTGVRVERLTDINEVDARAEGCDAEIMPACCGEGATEDHGIYGTETVCCGMPVDSESFVEGYRKLWDSLNAARGYGWEVNPWVWMIKFRKTEGAQFSSQTIERAAGPVQSLGFGDST